MRRLCLLTLSFLFLVSCASWRAVDHSTDHDTELLTLDHEPSAASTKSVRASKSGKSSAAKAAKTTPKNSAIVVEQSDVDLGNRMAQAMDSYVFKSDEVDFKKLCTDTRFDCSVDGARFPAKRKTVKRKVPAFLSGSKMGFKGEQRVQVKYDFYP